MRAVVQRVTEAYVDVGDERIGEIGAGLLVLLGTEEGDTDKDLTYTLDKIVNLRVFEDDDGRMNRSLLDVGGALLVVSQFTLLGDCRRGRRPSFIKSQKPDLAEAMVESFVQGIRARGVEVATGRFGAMMKVGLVNDGPVTLLIDSRKTF